MALHLEAALSASDDASGVTESERYLHRLARRTFLSLWAYPNLFRNQGTHARGGEGAELCDLLAVFDKHIFIFSDKSCEWPGGGNEDVAWARWYRKAVLKSADQAWGAERWISNHPDRIFTDRACTERIPLSISITPDTQIHRIVVARDPSGRRRALTGGSGSLLIDMRIVGDDHLRARAAGGRPFAVGDLDPQRGFVHVLDEVSLDLILGTVDTVADFAEYLVEKTRVLRSGNIVGAFGEEELLAYFLKNVGEDGKRTFSRLEAVRGSVVGPGQWSDLRSRPEFQNKLRADRISYNWDRIIEEVAAHALAGTLVHTIDPSIATQERIVRAMAAEPRVRRRILALDLGEIVERARDGRRHLRTSAASTSSTLRYVFLSWGPHERLRSTVDHNIYRAERRDVLAAYCAGVIAHDDSVKHVVGIATEDAGAEERSFDVAYVAATDLAPDDLLEARQRALAEGWFQNLAWSELSEDEYPLDGAIAYPMRPTKHGTPKLGRNEPCYCGSGRKFKRCHGRN